MTRTIRWMTPALFLAACVGANDDAIQQRDQAVAATPAAHADITGPGKDFCADFGVPCYSPLEMRKAYGIDRLIDAGFDGTGQTIVIIDSFGSPTIAEDLKAFDDAYGIPAPPSFQVLAPLGTVPFDPTNGDQVFWAYEASLDVEYAHAMAPGASIILMTSPVSEVEGTTGLPEFLALETYALDHHLGTIISQSWGATENTLMDPAGRALVAQFERHYARARREHVTVVTISGDQGSSGYDNDLNLYPFRVVEYPGSSPNVLTVGGTALYTDDDGNWAAEFAWGTPYGGGGGGVSQLFPQPLFQRFLPRAVQQRLGGHRGIPDVAYNASQQTPVFIYITDPTYGAGFVTEAGTSAGAPQWAGIVADLNQVAGRPLGFLNDKLYLLSALGLLRHDFHDVTSGNNSLGGVPGYDATPGWDLVTGLGTPALEHLGALLASLPDAD